MKKLEADLACPKCHRKFKQRVDEIVPGRSRRCAGCGLNITFTGDDGRQVQRALDKLEGQLKNLGGRFR